MKNFAQKYKSVLLPLLINLLLLFLAFGGFYREAFGSDGMGQRIMPLININNWRYYGRYLAYLFSYILYRCNINVVMHYHFFYLFFMLVIALSLCVVQRTFLRVLPVPASDTVLLAGFYAATALVFINGLFCEHFMFAECFPGFALAWLLSMCSISFLTEKKWIPGVLLLLAADMFYQAPTVVAAIMTIAYIFMKADGRPGKKQYAHALLTLLLVLGCIALTVTAGLHTLARLGDPDDIGREIAVGDISYKIQSLIQAVIRFCQSGFGLLPALWIPLIGFLFPAVCIFLAASSQKSKGLFYRYLLFLLVSLGLSLSLSAGMDSMRLSPRLLGGLYATQALSFLLVYRFASGETLRRRTAYFAVCYLCVQMIFCNTIMMNHYISFEQDLKYADLVYEEIRAYEEKTGNRVTRVAERWDARVSESYANVYYKFGQINERCIRFAPYAFLTLASDGRTYERAEMDPEIYAARFAGKDWDEFNADEQLFFQGDTLYWIIF